MVGITFGQRKIPSIRADECAVNVFHNRSAPEAGFITIALAVPGSDGAVRGLFVPMDAARARDFAANLFSAADHLDQGKGKQ